MFRAPFPLRFPRQPSPGDPPGPRGFDDANRRLVGQLGCPWHGASYNIRTGEVLGPPASTGVASYTVRVQGSRIEIEVP